MKPRSPQKWFCNACGREMLTADFGLGRRFRCCSAACVKEMGWREALSLVGEPYKRDPERTEATE